MRLGGCTLGKDAGGYILGNGRPTGYSRGTRSPTHRYCDANNTLPKVVDRLGLSFSSTKELNEIIDQRLPGRPPFQCREFVIGGETLELHFRDVLSCIRSIYGDPSFACDLVVAPEHHYADRERTVRIYSEMHTGDWWWAVQVRKPTVDLE
jgi:hypothetical protein